MELNEKKDGKRGLKAPEVKQPAGLEMIKKLIESGIPLRQAIFNKTVLSWRNEPENAFYSPQAPGRQPKPSRTANLWYTPHGVVTEQGGVYKIIPLANVSDTFAL